MSLEAVRNTLLWCTAINVAVLVVWSLLWVLPHQWIYRLTSRRFRLTPEQFDAISFAGIVVYKLGILFFNLVPYIALRIVA
jgi:hypothetical protein